MKPEMQKIAFQKARKRLSKLAACFVSSTQGSSHCGAHMATLASLVSTVGND
jgi:hypothetical protein